MIADFSKLCIHTITTKPWAIEVAMDKYADAGVAGITVTLSEFIAHCIN